MKSCELAPLVSVKDKTHSLHNVGESVQSNVGGGCVDLGVHCHADTLQDSSSNEGPFSTKKGQLDKDESENGTKNTGEVDVDVLSVHIANGVLTVVDGISVKNDGQEVSGQIERPVVSLYGQRARRLVAFTHHVRDSQQDKDEGL